MVGAVSGAEAVATSVLSWIVGLLPSLLYLLMNTQRGSWDWAYGEPPTVPGIFALVSGSILAAKIVRFGLESTACEGSEKSWRKVAARDLHIALGAPDAALRQLQANTAADDATHTPEVPTIAAAPAADIVETSEPALIDTAYHIGQAHQAWIWGENENTVAEFTNALRCAHRESNLADVEKVGLWLGLTLIEMQRYEEARTLFRQLSAWFAEQRDADRTLHMNVVALHVATTYLQNTAIRADHFIRRWFAQSGAEISLDGKITEIANHFERILITEGGQRIEQTSLQALIDRLQDWAVEFSDATVPA